MMCGMFAFLWMENADDLWVCRPFCGWRMLMKCGYVVTSVGREC